MWPRYVTCHVSTRSTRNLRCQAWCSRQINLNVWNMGKARCTYAVRILANTYSSNLAYENRKKDLDFYTDLSLPTEFETTLLKHLEISRGHSARPSRDAQTYRSLFQPSMPYQRSTFLLKVPYQRSVFQWHGSAKGLIFSDRTLPEVWFLKWKPFFRIICI